MDYSNVRESLDNVSEFLNDYTNTLLDPTTESASKQVYFMDVQPEIKKHMSFLRDLKNDTSASQELSKEADDIIKKFQDTTEKFKQACLLIPKDITHEETTANFSEKTLKKAVQTNKTTQKLTKDMDVLEKQQAIAANKPQFNFALSLDGSAIYFYAETKEEITNFINQEIQAKKGCKSVELYKVSFKPVKLKTQTIVTLE